jgi:hypothetical protein
LCVAGLTADFSGRSFQDFQHPDCF